MALVVPEAGRPPRPLDEMYAGATSEFERSSITDLLFGSVTDVLDRYFPDRDKHGALRGMLALSRSTPPTGVSATPGSAAALAFGLAVPDEDTALMNKPQGGIGALTTYLREQFAAAGGELRLRSGGYGDPRRRRPGEWCYHLGRIRLRCARCGLLPRPRPDAHPAGLCLARSPPICGVAVLRGRPSRSYVQMHFAFDGARVRSPLRTAQRPVDAGHRPAQHPEELQQQWEDCRRGIVPADPAIASRSPRHRSRPGAARQARGIGISPGSRSRPTTPTTRD